MRFPLGSLGLPIHDSLAAGVHVEPRPARETNQGHPEFFRNRQREAGRCANRHDDREASDRGFLQDLEAGPAAHREEAIGQGHAVREERLPDDLVGRIVSPHVFPQTPHEDVM